MANKKNKLVQFLKAPIMSIVIVARLMPGIPTYDTRILFYFAVIVPFIPIFKYAENFIANYSVVTTTILYFLFYLLSNILVTYQVKKIGKTWKESEYRLLTVDQITFPFILVCLINSLFHFGLYYLIINSFVL